MAAVIVPTTKKYFYFALIIDLHGIIIFKHKITTITLVQREATFTTAISSFPPRVIALDDSIGAGKFLCGRIQRSSDTFHEAPEGAS